VLAGASLLVLEGCGRGTPTPLPDWMITTAVVSRASMSQSVSILGQVSPIQGLQLAFDTVDGRVLEVLVAKGQSVVAGDALVRLDTTAAARTLREAEADLGVAQAALTAAERPASVVAIADAEGALAAAEEQMAAAKLALDVATQAGAEAYQQAVDDAQVALQAARDAYAQQDLTANLSEIRELEYNQAFFERALRDLTPGQDPGEDQAALANVKAKLAAAHGARAEALGNARDAVVQAQRQLDLAKAALASVSAGDIDLLADERLAYQRAVLARDQAQAALGKLRTGGDADKLAAAQTAYDVALARVDGLKASIEAATLRAPIAGAVLDLFVKPDDWAAANTAVAYLADPSLTHILAQVSELDVVQLSEGQAVRVSFDALPGVLTTGVVTHVDVRGEASQGAVTFQVEVVLDKVVEGLIQGMSATVRVLVGERENVLTVPAAAVQYDMSGQSVVYVRADNGDWLSAPVDLGMNDGILVEVLDGVDEGQTVRIPVSIEAPTPAATGGEAPVLR
jgi:multidrug efflux pump subunit AcrA (membrane-fusion protein)